MSLATVALIAGGCNSVQVLRIPTPPRAAAGITTTTTGVTTTVPEQPVPGSAPSTSVAIEHGSARINGTVLGPSGPVEGATVEIRRYVGNSAATFEATTAADGSFNVAGIRGGRYGVRAWEAPSLAETSPQVFFLAAGGTRTLNVQLTSYSGLKVESDVNPATPFVGQPVNLAVEVTQPTVDNKGNVSQVPQVSVTIQLESTGFVPFRGGPSMATTGDNGEAILGITCTQGGVSPITLLVGGSTIVSVPAPFCLLPPTTTTTSPTTLAPTTTVPTTTAPTTTAPVAKVPVATTTTPTTTAPTTPAPTTPTTPAPTAPTTTTPITPTTTPTSSPAPTTTAQPAPPHG